MLYCVVIAKGFMSLLAVTGVAHLCDHAPQPLHCCSIPILSTLIYRIKKSNTNKYKKQQKIA